MSFLLEFYTRYAIPKTQTQQGTTWKHSGKPFTLTEPTSSSDHPQECAKQYLGVLSSSLNIKTTNGSTRCTQSPGPQNILIYYGPHERDSPKGPLIFGSPIYYGGWLGLRRPSTTRGSGRYRQMPSRRSWIQRGPSGQSLKVCHNEIEGPKINPNILPKGTKYQNMGYTWFLN